MIKVSIQRASGRSKCRRCNKPYGNKLIPIGERILLIESDYSGGQAAIYLCNEHAREFSYEVEEIGQTL